MRAGGAIDKDKTAVALSHEEIKGMERDRETAGVVGNLPCCQYTVTNFIDGN